MPLQAINMLSVPKLANCITTMANFSYAILWCVIFIHLQPRRMKFRVYLSLLGKLSSFATQVVTRLGWCWWTTCITTNMTHLGTVWGNIFWDGIALPIKFYVFGTGHKWQSSNDQMTTTKMQIEIRLACDDIRRIHTPPSYASSLR